MRPSDWELMKAYISRLYLEDDKTPSEVRAIIEADFGITATWAAEPQAPNRLR